jgi:thiamine-phosphate pyrophosphorylase
MKAFADCRLYTFVDTAYLRGRDPAEVARQLCDGGADLVQVRAKDADPDTVRRLTEAVLPITTAAGVWCVLNDHWQLGRELGVPCVHVGQEDFFDAGFRRVSELQEARTARPAVGLSSHAPEQAQRAVAAGADYVAVGPVFPTGTKPGRPAVTLEYVRWAAAHLRVPWFAIGGIHAGNLAEVLAAGATRVCVVSAILGAEDVAKACRTLRRQLP